MDQCQQQAVYRQPLDCRTRRFHIHARDAIDIRQTGSPMRSAVNFWHDSPTVRLDEIRGHITGYGGMSTESEPWELRNLTDFSWNNALCPIT